MPRQTSAACLQCTRSMLPSSRIRGRYTSFTRSSPHPNQLALRIFLSLSISTGRHLQRSHTRTTISKVDKSSLATWTGQRRTTRYSGGANTPGVQKHLLGISCLSRNHGWSLWRTMMGPLGRIRKDTLIDIGYSLVCLRIECSSQSMLLHPRLYPCLRLVRRSTTMSWTLL